MNGLIHLMAEVAGRMECTQKERANPKQPLQPDYTRTQRVLVEMLTENTGCSILDSGGADVS